MTTEEPEGKSTDGRDYREDQCVGFDEPAHELDDARDQPGGQSKNGNAGEHDPSTNRLHGLLSRPEAIGLGVDDPADNDDEKPVHRLAEVGGQGVDPPEDPHDLKRGDPASTTST